MQKLAHIPSNSKFTAFVNLLNGFAHELMHGISSAFSVGNRVDDPLQKVGSSSSAAACKNTSTSLPWRCWKEVWMQGRSVAKGKIDSEWV